ncbi:hypothetical protein EXM22_04480 [Oceanispirochaeta crateris]|uniref:Tetratricopeptide repeat protein n=1 Tax=Oceanispirochaeta crateris TaxID=2518645 RepID=A0A5C1QJD4_9SPIO|nr:hypothetical protein [Oceanispirochaeta crateris]QEN07279.1 hypothetical protein EXM22_04480 [Oceanispirochaeta crateris]
MNRILFISFILLIFLIPLSAQEKEGSGQDLSALDLYQSGDYQNAATRFLEDARGTSGDSQADLYYNGARSYHQDYLENQNADSLDKAVSGYYRVLDMNPDMKEAQINLELLRLEQEKLQNEKDQQNSGQQGEQQGDQQQDSQGNSQGNEDSKAGESDLNDLAEQQQKLSESDQDGKSQSRQEELADKTEQALENEQDPQVKEDLNQALEHQQQALEQMKREEYQDAQKSQQAAAEALKRAASGTEEEALSEDLQSLLNQEQKRKEQTDSKEIIRVEKDW